MAQILRQSTQVIVVIGPFVDVGDAFTPETGVTLSGADEAEILKANTSTTTDISGATWAAITGCDGYYALTLTTSHTDTVGALTVMVNDDSVCLPVLARFQVIEEAAYDAMYAASADPKADINVATIDANAITATAIAADAITAAKIADGAIDANTFAANAITATAIAADAITAAKIADGAIDANTFATGAITAAAIAADAIGASELAADAVAEIADAVWDEDATGHQTGGTFGQAIGDPGADTNTIFKAVVTDATGATVGVDVAAVLADTGTDGVIVATNNDKTGYRLSATGVDDIHDEAVDGSTTFRESTRLQNAVLVGKASGLATTTAVYRDLADSKDRVTATVDADGNRTAVTKDAS